MKLTEWMSTPSFQAREKASAAPDEPVRPSLANTTKASSSLLPSTQSGQENASVLSASNEVTRHTVTTAAQVQSAKPAIIAIPEASAPQPTPATSLSNSMTEKPLLLDTRAAQSKKESNAKLGKPRYEPGQPTAPLEATAPLRLNAKATRPNSTLSTQTSATSMRKIGGEIAFTVAWTEIEASLHE